MGAAHENRVKRKIRREYDANGARRTEREAMRLVRSPRAPLPASPPPPSKARVLRWMCLHASEYTGATQLAEGANAALDLPKEWLDDPDHWIWDLAAKESDR